MSTATFAFSSETRDSPPSPALISLDAAFARSDSTSIVGGQTGAVTFVQRFGGALNLNPHLHSILPDGLWFADAPTSSGSGERLRFQPLPAPTTADVEELIATIARRGMERVAATWEADGSGYLDPNLAALCEAFFFSRNAPVGTRENPMLPGMESGGEEGESVRGKSLCASVEGFSLHAAQAVPAEDREALERLLRYGLRAPFSQERLSRRSDGKVVYKLRRPWPNERGATHLILEPLDFLRRLAALVSFPYSHQIRRHGVFANRHRFRGLLPPPPPSRHAQETASPEMGELGDADVASGGKGPTSTELTPRRRVPWAQLLRRVLYLDALACPRCSTPSQRVPMIVLAFLTDPEVVGKILRHLGLPVAAPLIAPARSSGPALGFALPDEDSISSAREEDGGRDFVTPEDLIRPPP